MSVVRKCPDYFLMESSPFFPFNVIHYVISWEARFRSREAYKIGSVLPIHFCLLRLCIGFCWAGHYLSSLLLLMNHKPVRQHIPKLQWVNRKCLKGMKFLIELRLTDQCARADYSFTTDAALLIFDSLSPAQRVVTGVRGGPYCHSKGILSKEKQMIMSYNCISSPSVCCLASILVGNREWGVAIHMNSNLMTLSVCNLSTPPNCNCNADDQGLSM